MLHVKYLSLASYESIWRKMQTFTEERTKETIDEVWLVEHPPVYTLGLAGKKEHLLNTGDIPVVQTDRGGQVTYHGPGQLVLYVLLDIRRKNLTIRNLVCALEKTILSLIADYGIMGYTKPSAPGVYVNQAKLASLGLKIRKGFSYHGLSLNVNMDLSPFKFINPCGYKGLAITSLSDLGGPNSIEKITDPLLKHLCHHLEYTQIEVNHGK